MHVVGFTIEIDQKRIYFMLVLSNGLLDNEECDQAFQWLCNIQGELCRLFGLFVKLSKLSWSLCPARNTVSLVPAMSWDDSYAQE